MRKLPLATRHAADAIASPETEVGLIRITHPRTGQVVRLSTDPTERLSVQPLSYGTRSAWLTGRPDLTPFLFVLLSVLVPDDKSESPGAGQLVIDAADDAIGRTLRSFSDQALIDIAIVRVAAVDVPIEQWLHFELVSAEMKGDAITLSFSRDRMTTEPWPYQRMNRSTTPGLHR